jgi:hypothetical protein
LRSELGTENHLNDAAAIPEMDEEYLTMIPQSVHPPSKKNLPANI